MAREEKQQTFNFYMLLHTAWRWSNITEICSCVWIL